MKYPTLDPDERRRRLSVPSGRIRLVLDTDAKNEIDDRFAIAWALRSPDRFCVEAVYAAPFSHDCLRSLFGGKSLEHAPGITYAEDPAAGMEQSYEEIVKLYQMMGMDPAGKVFRGAGEYLVDKGAPVDSPAVQDLIRREQPGTVVCGRHGRHYQHRLRHPVGACAGGKNRGGLAGRSAAVL